MKDRGMSIVIKSSDQIKSADPVTYDDDGNVITLSQRFKSDKRDIRYSVAEDFEDELNEWDEIGRPAGESFVPGSTGDVLQGLGAIESDIYMLGDKISKILADHPEMTLEEIKKIPEILDDPVLVLKSKGVSTTSKNTRLIIFGAVRAKNGKPVLSVLDLKPRENNLIIDDMQKVNSSYTKKNAEDFIATSEVLYADEKRTIPLLRLVGLAITSRQLLHHGSVGNIRYQGNNVKIEGVKVCVK